MSWFKCLIAGENFPGVLIGESNNIGFYTTRFVEAKDQNEAETIVLKNLKNEKSLVLPPETPRPTDANVYFESIEEVDKSAVPAIDVGFSFFVMGT